MRTQISTSFAATKRGRDSSRRLFEVFFGYAESLENGKAFDQKDAERTVRATIDRFPKDLLAAVQFERGVRPYGSGVFR